MISVPTQQPRGKPNGSGSGSGWTTRSVLLLLSSAVFLTVVLMRPDGFTRRTTRIFFHNVNSDQVGQSKMMGHDNAEKAAEDASYLHGQHVLVQEEHADMSSDQTVAEAETGITDEDVSSKSARDRLVHETLNEFDPIDANPPQMSAGLAKMMAKDNTVIVTWANYALWDFVKSWVRHLNDLGINNILVGAMDQQIGEAMVLRKIPSFAMYATNQSHSGVGAEHLAWGGEGFHKMGRQKISLAKLFLEAGVNLFLVDVDVVILRDVLPYFDRYPQADILVSTDLLSTPNDVGDDGLEKNGGANAPMNIGIMFFRNNPKTLKFVTEWLDRIIATPDLWDQVAFNDMARADWDPFVKVKSDNPRVWLGYNGTLGVGVLPTSSFAGGHNFYIQKIHEVQKVEPYAVHCTFQYGGNIGKRNRMREAMLFYDDEEYYTGDNYIMIDVKTTPTMNPEEFLKLNYTQMKAYNVKGLNWQLASIFPSLGMSYLFNRSLILPKVACFCDRYWQALDMCRLPGALKQRLPFVAPMDYVLQPEFFTDDHSTVTFRWREHSFLDNPRCPQKDAMAKYSQYKVWHFKSPAETFVGFDDDDLQLQYKKRIEYMQPVVQPDKAKDGTPM
eukprot:gene28760-31942_t